MPRRARHERWFAAALCAAVLFSCAKSPVPDATQEPPAKRVISVFHAGSLSVPMKLVKAEFEKLHPEFEVTLEAAGSRELARKITELGKTCDLFMSADVAVIKELLIPVHSDEAISFATNEIGIALRTDSPAGEKITQENWREKIIDPSIRIGRANPNLDPCGYRTVLSWKLIESHFKMPGFFERMLAKSSEKFIRPKEVDLLALLEAGEVDGIFLYKSVAIQHKLGFVTLPAEVNLGDPSKAEFYGTVSVEVTGKNPGEMTTIKGEPIVYGLCVTKAATNRDGAELLKQFILGDAGRKIFESSGQNFVTQ